MNDRDPFATGGSGVRRRKQEPLYFSNSAFVSLIVLFAALGGFGQVSRVGGYSKSLLEQVESVHDDCSKDLKRRRLGEDMVGVNEGGGGEPAIQRTKKDERIHTFLKVRDPVGYAAVGVVGAPKEGGAGVKGVGGTPDVCSSGDVYQS